jgi:superfamily II DNA or RNA helicase
MEKLFEAVRQACPPAVWSRGVELNRASAVHFERADEDEVVFRISSRGGMISRAVIFFLDDGEWECECDALGDGCEHAAAAVIAWRRADEEGGGPDAAGSSRGRVGYRFSREGGSLALRRVIVTAEGSLPLETTLAALANGRVEGPRFVASQADLAVELALETHRQGVLERRLLPRLFARLEYSDDIVLDELKVSVSRQPVLPVARLTDQGEGFRLRVEEDPSVREVFRNGAALCDGTLRPLGVPKLTGREREELARGRYYGPDSVAELVTEILPGLRTRIPVEIETDRLPRTGRVAPRIHFEFSREEQTLSVLATVLYGDPPQARIDGGRLVHLAGDVPVRDEHAERRLLERLRTRLGLSPGVRALFRAEEAVAFNAKLERWKEPVEDDERQWFRLAPPLVPEMRVHATGFELEFESRPGEGSEGAVAGGRARPEDVMRAWREGASLVPLLEGGWAPLPQDWLARFGHRVADLLSARAEGGELPRASLPALARLCEELDQPPPPEFAELAERLESLEGVGGAELPADLTATLRGYQRKGVDWLVFMREAGLGALLADDMGLGKTLQALCAIRGRALVVAPTSVLHNWADEIRRFRPGLSCASYHGPGRRLDRSIDVTLTTYAILRLDADRLAEERWETVVLDEAQAIKNPDSQVAAAAYRLQADHRLTLTGTPVENRLDELWSQFHFLNRGYLGGRQDFRERYASAVAAGEPGAAERLRERIRPFVLRRMKQQVAPELPPRTEMVLRCELDEREREIYDTVRAATLNEVVQRLGAGGNVIAALEALLRLRQAASHPALVPGQEAERSTKVDLLIDAVENVVAEGHKALVFSQWTSLLDLTEPHLRRTGVDFLRLDGSTRDRAGVVRGFQDAAGPPVLLISLKAGGTGLNLTAADHIFLLDPWWNPAVEDQAADRAHRIGQDRPVMVYRMVAAETVEERILDLQARKREVAEAALGGADAAAGITRAELLELLT